MSQRAFNPNGNRHERSAARKLTQPSDSMNIVLPREFIERGDVKPFLVTLETMVESPESVRRFRDRLFIVITGYDSDPRQWHQVREIRDFLTKLDEEFPYLFWFLNRSEPSFLVTLLLSVVEDKSRAAAEHRARLEDLRSFMLRHYESLDELGALYRLSRDEVESRQVEIGEYFKPIEAATRLAPGRRLDTFDKILLLKLTLPCAGAILTLTSWLLHACTGTGVAIVNISGPLVAGLGLGFILIPSRDMLDMPNLATRHNVKLAAGMIVGCALGLVNSLLLCP